jgi:CPA2 family monovalent cation:H+ antiporter-2
MQTSILSSTVVVFGLSIVVLLLCYRLKVPTIVGFLVTGVLCGPSGFGLVAATAEVQTLAQIGVVLLLFSIGLEFSFHSLLKIKRIVLAGGSLQVLVTTGAVAFIAWRCGLTIQKSVFMGFLLSLSSTAIVLKRLQEKGEVESPHGTNSLGILIFQDIIVVPMMLVLPLLSGALAGTSGIVGPTVISLVVRIVLILVCMSVMIRWVVPWVMFRVAKTKSRELFLLTIIVICFSVAWLTSGAGLSLALGAFCAGLVLSESEYSWQALGSIIPFKDVFSSLFFISIGMLFDGAYFIRHPVLVVSLAFAVIFVKTVIASIVPAVLGFPLRTMVLTGLSLSQVGEFSFILSTAGMALGLIDKDTYQLFLGISILTMAATPFIMSCGPWISDRLLSLPLPKRLTAGLHSGDTPGTLEKRQKLNDHLVIIGFGINGRNVARAARAMGIPYVITEMNPETVRREKAAGEPIIYGDATQEAVLRHVDISTARVVVVGIPDPIATRRVVEATRALNPSVHIISRTRFFQETAQLYELGANEVIPEEFETSVEIFTRVLVKYLVPPDVIEMFVAEVRSDSYQMFRSLSKESATFGDLKFALPDVEVSMAWVGEGSALTGKSIAEIKLRSEFGITLLAVRRGSEVISNPDSSVVLADGDILVILGKPQDIVRFNGALKAK